MNCKPLCDCLAFLLLVAMFSGGIALSVIGCNQWSYSPNRTSGFCMGVTHRGYYYGGFILILIGLFGLCFLACCSSSSQKKPQRQYVARIPNHSYDTLNNDDSRLLITKDPAKF